MLSSDDKTGIKNVLVNTIINYPENAGHEHNFYLNKLNGTLISIVKYEWRSTW